jgi:hypothetical protein
MYLAESNVMMMVGSVSENTVVRTDADQFMFAPVELNLEKEGRLRDEKGRENCKRCNRLGRNKPHVPNKLNINGLTPNDSRSSLLAANWSVISRLTVSF